MCNVSSMLLGRTSQHFLQWNQTELTSGREYSVEGVVVTSWTREQLEAFAHVVGIMAPHL